MKKIYYFILAIITFCFGYGLGYFTGEKVCWNYAFEHFTGASNCRISRHEYKKQMK